jgi:hypothetical protein
MKYLLLIALAALALTVAAPAGAATIKPTSCYWSCYSHGYGRYNAAGFPKNQYVRPYYSPRRATWVSGYWRNSPYDSYPTCRYIHC